MAETPLTAEGIYDQLNKNFPSIQTTAVSHVEANGGDHFFMVLVRADPPGQGDKQQATGSSHGSKHVKPPKRHSAAEDTPDDDAEKLNSVLNRHLIRLLQGRPGWKVFSDKSKQQPTGVDSGHKHVGGHSASAEVPEHEGIPSVNGEGNGFAGQAAGFSQQAADSVDAVFQTLSDMEP